MLHVQQPEPADGWPDRPLSAAEAAALLGDTADSGDEIADGDAAVDTDAAVVLDVGADDVVAVWVMDHETGVRSTVVPDDAPSDAVVDVVLETTTGFEMYSFTRGQWMDYGTQDRGDEAAPSMAGTLESYRVVAGESSSF